MWQNILSVGSLEEAWNTAYQRGESTSTGIGENGSMRTFLHALVRTDPLKRTLVNFFRIYIHGSIQTDDTIPPLFFTKWLIENTSSTSWEDACMWCLFKSIHFRIQTEDTSTYAYWGTSLLVPVISFLIFFFKTYIIEMPFTIRKNRNSKCKKFLNHIHSHSCKDIARKPFIGEIIGKSTSRVISIKKLRWDEYWVDRRPVILVWIDSFVQPFATI